jgi:hypothetical protein
MANVYGNEILLGGAREALEALKSTIDADAPEWFEDGVLNEIGADDQTLSGTFSSRGRTPFTEVEAFSSAHPDIVVSVSSVDLGNRVAEAKVYRGGAMVGGYDMPDDEIDDLDTGYGEEGPIFEGLSSTVDAYFQDEVAKLPAPAPRP